MQSKRAEYLLLGLLASLWGSSYLLIEIALQSIPPVTLIAIRVSVAALLLSLLALLQGRVWPKGRTIWARLVLQSFLNSFGAWTLLAWGQQTTDSGLAGVLNSTSPIFVVLISALFLRAPTRLLTAAGVAVGLGGVVLIMGPEVLRGLGDSVLAQSAILLGAVLYALAALHGARLSALSPVVTAACTMIVASLVLIPAALLLEQPWPSAPSPVSLAAALALGVFSTAVALLIYFRIVVTLGPVAVASQAYLRAGIALLLGITILGESVELSAMAGVFAALLGVMLINWPVARRPAKG